MYFTYVDAFRPQAGRSAAVYDLAMIAAGSLVIALTAQVAFYLPGTPIPITGQTLGVLLVGMLLGPGRGAAAVAAYLGQGALGLPVFAGWGSGLVHLAGPAGGYLLAFLPAAWLTGLLARMGWDRKLLTAVAAMLLGNVIIYIGGATWLALWVGPAQAVAMGVAPFVIGDFVKIVLAAGLLPGGWKLLDKLRKTGR